MNELVKQLKEEILGKEFEILDLDNLLVKETGSDSNMFDDLRGALESKSYAYLVKYHEESGIADYINVIFEIVSTDWEEMLEDNYDYKKIVVKVTDIEEI